MVIVRELFFYFSGEHDTLPYAEVRAILEAEDFHYMNVLVIPRLLCIKSDVNCLTSVANRSYFTKNCGLVILKCEARKRAILRAVEKMDYNLKRGQTFSVKIKIIQHWIDAKELEKAIGQIILKKFQGTKVKLTNPDISFFGIFSPNVFVLGQMIYSPSRDILKRKLTNRPFTHPSSMVPESARVMVNLVRASARSLVLDPFCGAGSILVEAGLIGCKILGSEINSKMLRGAMHNLRYFDISWEGLVISDARSLPFKNFDCIVTDPPYGRASSTHGESTREIVGSFLAEAMNVLPRRGYISIALPSELRINEITKGTGFINVESHLIRVHKSLTREISVIQRP